MRRVPRLFVRRWSAALGSVTLLVVANGCYSVAAGVRRRAAVEFSCAEDQIRVEAIGAGAARAAGCGRSATYVCTGGGWNAPVCVHDEASGPTSGGSVASASRSGLASAPASRIPPRSDESIRRALTLARPALESCLPAALTRIVVRFTVNELGRVTYSAPMGAAASVEVHRCVTLAFRDVEVDEQASSPRTVTVTLSRGTERDDGIADAEPPSPGAEARTGSDALAAAVTTLRAAIDAHRSEILACVGVGTVAVTVSFDAAGAVSVALRGSLAGTDEEDCVRAVLADQRVDPLPGVAGSLIHAVAAE